MYIACPAPLQVLTRRRQLQLKEELEKVKKDKGKLKAQEGANDDDQVGKKAEPKAKGKAKAAKSKAKGKAKAKAKVSKGEEEPASPVIRPEANPTTPHQSPEDVEMENARNEISLSAARPEGLDEPHSPIPKRKLFDSDQECAEAESVTAQPSQTKPGRKKRAAPKRKASALETGGSKGSPPLRRRGRAKAVAKPKASPKAAAAAAAAPAAPSQASALAAEQASAAAPEAASAPEPAAPAVEPVPKAKAKAKARGGAKAKAEAKAAGRRGRRPRLAPAPEMLDDGIRDLMYKDMQRVDKLDFEELKDYAKNKAKEVDYKNSMLNIYWSRCAAGVKYQKREGGPEVAYFAFNLNMLGTNAKGPYNQRMMCAVNGAKLMVTKFISSKLSNCGMLFHHTLCSC